MRQVRHNSCLEKLKFSPPVYGTSEVPLFSMPSSLTNPAHVYAGVPKLRSVGRSVLLEEDDDEQDFATNAQRLLKLVDQDFADVAGLFCRSVIMT